LVENIKAKHSILNEDIYNFNELGFIIGIILTRAVVTGSISTRVDATTRRSNSGLCVSPISSGDWPQQRRQTTADQSLPSGRL
ncbi:hypothetical protein K491DRAFT_602397, partial [Lophiostoma macrostomum CBS 122681]